VTTNSFDRRLSVQVSRMACGRKSVTSTSDRTPRNWPRKPWVVNRYRNLIVGDAARRTARTRTDAFDRGVAAFESIDVETPIRQTMYGGASLEARTDSHGMAQKSLGEQISPRRVMTSCSTTHITVHPDWLVGKAGRRVVRAPRGVRSIRPALRRTSRWTPVRRLGGTAAAQVWSRNGISRSYPLSRSLPTLQLVDPGGATRTFRGASRAHRDR
jgi:hypothetical protein